MVFLADDASDPYSGIMQLAFNPMDATYRINDAYFAIDGTPMNGQRIVEKEYVSASDHALVAHTLRYTGPALRLADDGRLTLIWGPEAANYTPQRPLFLLTRNNQRNDMYLGNLADAQGSRCRCWRSCRRPSNRRRSPAYGVMMPRLARR